MPPLDVNQVLAGALETFAAGGGNEQGLKTWTGRNLPLGLHDVGALAFAGNDYLARKMYQGITGDKFEPNPLAQEALGDIVQIRDNANAIAGTSEPTNIGEMGLRNAVNLIPSPAMAVKAVSTGGKILKNVADVLLPGLGIKSAPAAVANVAVPALAGEQAATLTDAPGYTPAGELLNDLNPISEANAKDISVDAFNLLYTPKTEIVKDAVKNAQPTLSEDQPELDGGKEVSAAEFQKYYDANPQATADLDQDKPGFIQKYSGWIAPGVVLAAAFGAGAKSVANLGKTATPVLGSVGKNAESTPLSVADIFAQDMIDSQYTLGKAVKAVEGWKGYDDFWSMMATRTGDGGAHMALETLKSGVFPGNSADRGPSIAKMRVDYDTLTPAQQKLFNEGMIARDVTNQRKLTAMQPGNAGKQADQLPQTTGELRKMYQNMQKDPALVAIEQHYRKATDSVLDYWVETGRIDKYEAREYRKRFSIGGKRTYVPNFEIPDEMATFGEKLKTSVLKYWDQPERPKGLGGTDDFFKNLMERATDPGMGPKNFANPMDALEIYMFTAIEHTNKNIVRNSFLSRMANTVNKEWKGQVTLIPKNKLKGIDPRELVTTFDKGSKVHYRVKDPSIRQGLEFSPFFYSTAMGKTFDGLRQLKQFNTTGPGAPWFPPISAVYEAITQSITRKPGQSVGYIDDLMQSIGFKPGLPGDPTSLLRILDGTARGVAGRSLYGASLKMRGLVKTQNPWLNKLLPKQMVNKISDDMFNAYLRSSLHQLNKYGGAGGNITFEKNANNVRDSLTHALVSSRSSLNPRSATSASWKAYMAMMGSVSESVRLSRFQQNIKRTKDLQGLASDVRKGSGDASRRGGGDAGKILHAGIPWWDPAVQEVRSVMQAVRRWPVSSIVGAATMIGSLKMMEMANVFGDPEKEDYYMTRINESDRANSINAVYRDEETGMITHTPLFPIVPTFAPIAASMYAFGAEMLGFNARRYGEYKPEFFDPMREGVTRMLGLATHPLLEFGTTAVSSALTGKPHGLDVMNPEQSVVSSLKPALSGVDAGTEQVRNDPWDVLVAEAFRDFLGTVGSIVVNTVREGALAEGAGEAKWDRALESLEFERDKRTPMGNILFGNETYRLTAGTWLRDEFHDKLSAVDKLTMEGKLLQMGSGTMTGRQYPMDAYGAQVLLAQQSPELQAVAMTLMPYGQELNQWKSQLNTLRQQRQDINDNGKFDIYTRNRLTNDKIEEEIKLAETALNRLKYIEGSLSKQLGKEVTFQDLVKMLQ